jgi:RHS repeat-associated protein
MTWDGRFFHTWDAENRLITSQQGGTVTNGSVRVENGYDYLHRRVSKTVRRLTGRGSGYPLDPSQPGTWEIEETRTFLYDGWNLVRETASDTNGVTETVEYFWGPDLSGTLQGAGDVGGLLAVSIGGSFYFPCYDNNGNVVAYIDENGTFRAEYVYDAFGKTIRQSGDMADVFRFRFSTKYYDAETGLYYYGYRFYVPELGRWFSRDPIEENDGKNVYSFLENEPINSIDIRGLHNYNITILPVEEVNYVLTSIEGLAGGKTVGLDTFSHTITCDCDESTKKYKPNITLKITIKSYIVKEGVFLEGHGNGLQRV